MSTAPTASAADRFNALELSRYFAHEIAHRDGELLTLRMMDHSGTDRSPDDPFSSDYELTFNLVLGGSIVANGLGLGLIEHWKAYRSSPLLERTVREDIALGQEFIHFELTGQTGTLSVVARDFSFAVVRMYRVTHDHRPPSGHEA